MKKFSFDDYRSESDDDEIVEDVDEDVDEDDSVAGEGMYAASTDEEYEISSVESFEDDEMHLNELVEDTFLNGEEEGYMEEDSDLGSVLSELSEDVNLTDESSVEEDEEEENEEEEDEESDEETSEVVVGETDESSDDDSEEMFNRFEFGDDSNLERVKQKKKSPLEKESKEKKDQKKKKEQDKELEKKGEVESRSKKNKEEMRKDALKHSRENGGISKKRKMSTLSSSVDKIISDRIEEFERNMVNSVIEARSSSLMKLLNSLLDGTFPTV